MATLRDIRQKIKSVGNIQKITQAMELVAASHLHKAQAKAESSRPYTLKIKEILAHVIQASDDALQHPLITQREVKKRGVVIVAGDRGLCGSYNHNVFDVAESFLQEYQSSPVELILVGRKTVVYFREKPWAISTKLEGWGGKITYHQIEEFTRSLINFYLNGQLDEIWVIYTHFINVGAREVRTEKLLDIDIKATEPFKSNYIFEPDAAQIFAKILPQYFVTRMQSILNTAYASELAARMASMRTATKNAEEMIEALTLVRNKVRQFGITRELIEITSAAESLR